MNKGNEYKNNFENFISKKPFFIRLICYVAYVAIVIVVGGYAGDFWNIVVGKNRTKK